MASYPRGISTSADSVGRCPLAGRCAQSHVASTRKNRRSVTPHSGGYLTIPSREGQSRVVATSFHAFCSLSRCHALRSGQARKRTPAAKPNCRYVCAMDGLKSLASFIQKINKRFPLTPVSRHAKSSAVSKQTIQLEEPSYAAKREKAPRIFNGAPRARNRGIQTTFDCPRCGGTGHAPLTTVMSKTLSRLKAHGPITAYQLIKIMGVPHSTACNRLMDLVTHGLATREEVDGIYQYTAKP